MREEYRVKVKEQRTENSKYVNREHGRDKQAGM